MDKTVAVVAAVLAVVLGGPVGLVLAAGAVMVPAVAVHSTVHCGGTMPRDRAVAGPVR